MTLLKNTLKSGLALMILLLVSSPIFAQENEEATPENVGVFEFESEVIDYGTIEQNADGNRVFKFKNAGDAPIVISAAKGSCGCTVPTFSKEPVMPGETGEIKVKYATNRIGKFTKSVTLTSNASEATKRLTIKGEVLKPAVDMTKPAEGGTPAVEKK